MSDRIKCESFALSWAGTVGVGDAKALAYLCPNCSFTHLALYHNNEFYATATLSEESAEQLSRSLINPPTAEGIGIYTDG